METLFLSEKEMNPNFQQKLGIKHPKICEHSLSSPSRFLATEKGICKPNKDLESLNIVLADLEG